MESEESDNKDSEFIGNRTISLEEKNDNKKMTQIVNHFYDIDTLNRITIVHLT